MPRRTCLFAFLMAGTAHSFLHIPMHARTSVGNSINLFKMNLDGQYYGGVHNRRMGPKLQFSSSSSASSTLNAPATSTETDMKNLNKIQRAPLYLEDGVWLPEDSFALDSTVVRVPKFLSLDDIASIHAAAQYVKTKVGSHIRKLPVDLSVLGAGSGPIPRPPWMTTYLQSLGLNR